MAEARKPVSKSKKKATANSAARKPARKTAAKPPTEGKIEKEEVKPETAKPAPVAPPPPRDTTLPPPIAKNTDGGFKAFAIVIVSLTVLAGGGYLSWPIWSHYVDDYIPPALRGLKGADPAVAGLAGRVKALEDEARTRQSKDTAIAQLEAERARLRKQVTSLMARLENVEGAVKTVKQLVNSAASASEASSASEILKALSGRLMELEQQGGSLDALKQRISQIEERGIAAAGPAEPAAGDLRLNVAVAEIESRLAEIEQQRLSGADVSSGAPATVLAVAQLRKSIEGGQSFAKDLEALKALAGQDPALKAAAAVLEKYAASGIATLGQLRDQFGAIAGEIVHAPKALRADGWFDRMVNRISRLVTWRRIDAEDGVDTVSSVVARTETKLEFGDLIAAVETLETLASMSEDAAAAAAPWLTDAKARLSVERAISSMHVYAVTLLVPAKE